MKRIALLLRIHFSPVKEGWEEEHFFHLRVTQVRELRDQTEGKRGYQIGMRENLSKMNWGLMSHMQS